VESLDLSETMDTAVSFLNREAATSKDFFTMYYVNRDDSPILPLLNSITQNANPVKIIFSGNRGSGKTTELYNLKNILERHNYYVVFVPAIHDMNVADLYYTDVLLGLIKKSIDLISLERVKINKKLKKQLEQQLMQLAGDLTIEESLETKGGIKLSTPSKGFSEWIGAFFSREKTTRETIRVKADSLVNELLKTFNLYVTSFEEILGKRVVIIVDDLEKVTDLNRIFDILITHANVIGGLNCHMVLTVPPSLMYSPEAIPIMHSYSELYFLPPFQVRNKDGSERQDQIDCMKNIIAKRISEKLISSEALQFAAIQSGGLVTDFIRMLIISVNNASRSRSPSVNISFLKESFMSLANQYGLVINALIAGHEPIYYQILKDIHRDKDVSEKDEKFIKLLFYLFILEYRDSGLSWYDLHPAVKEVIRKKNLIIL
jgi:hypothetical protein